MVKRPVTTRQARKSRPGRGRLMIDFSVGGSRFAIEMSYVVKVEPSVELTPMPGVPAYVSGLNLVEDNLVAAIDLRKLMDRKGGDETIRSQIVLRHGNKDFAVLSESVPGFINLQGELQRSLVDLGGPVVGFAKHTDGVVEVLSVPRLYRAVAQRQDLEVKKVEDYTIADEEAKADPKRAPCEICESRGYLISNEEAIFSTVLAFVGEIAAGESTSRPSINAQRLRESIERSLTSAKPMDALESLGESQVGEAYLPLLLQLVRARHLPSCEACSREAEA